MKNKVDDQINHQFKHQHMGELKTQGSNQDQQKLRRFKRGFTPILVSSQLILASQAYAWDPLGDMRKAVAHYATVASDVASLGETARRRDEDKAQDRRKEAERARAIAVLQKKNELRTLEIQRGMTQQLVNTYQQNIRMLENLSTTMVSQLEGLKIVIKYIGVHSEEYESYKKTVADQYEQLGQWIDEMNHSQLKEEQGPNKDLLETSEQIGIQLKIYLDELEGLPKMAPEDRDQMSVEPLFEAAEVAIQLMKQETEKTKTMEQRGQSELQRLNTQIESLMK